MLLRYEFATCRLLEDHAEGSCLPWLSISPLRITRPPGSSLVGSGRVEPCSRGGLRAVLLAVMAGVVGGACKMIWLCICVLGWSGSFIFKLW